MGILSTLGLKKRTAAEIAAGLKHKREMAIKEEGLAKLRKTEMAFDNRIEKARHAAQPKPHNAHRSMSMGNVFGGGFGGAPQGGGIGGQSQYFDSMFAPPKPAPKKRHKKKKAAQCVLVKV